MQLDGPQQKQVQAALISAFPTRSDLEQMVFHGLDVHLGAITAEGTLSQVVFELLRWAQAQGRLEELIKAALVHNSRNAQLQSVAALLRVSSGQSSSGVPPAATLPRYWNVPYPRNPYFTGQEALLIFLHNMFVADGLVAVSLRTQAISGLGGIGKTQLAIEYAYRYRTEYQAVLWVNADTRQSLVSDYTALVPLLGMLKKNVQDQSIAVETVKHWLNTHDQWLLIFDNADNVRMVHDFFPLAGKGHVLLTTRAYAQGTVAQGIEVEPMEATQGALFLLRRAKMLALDALIDQSTIVDRNTATAIVQELGGLPLALDQAGAYIEETGCGLSGYLKRYQRQQATLMQRRGKLVTDHPEPVAATWSVAFKRVELASPAAAELLHLCAFLHPDAIPEEIVTEGVAELGPTAIQALTGDFIALDEVIETLRTYSLVRRNPDAQTLSLHRLVQTVIKNTMPIDRQRHWAERAVRSISRIFPHHIEVATLFLCQRYLLQAQVCKALIDQWSLSFPEAAFLLNQAGYYLKTVAQYKEAELFYQRAFSIRERVLGPDHPDTATSLYNLADLYRVQGRYIEAEPLYQRTLAIREQVLGLNHSDTAISLDNLGVLYWNQGRYAETELFYQRALSIREQVLEPHHPHIAASLNNLALLYCEQDRYTEAEPLYQRALAIRVRALGLDHPYTAISFNNIAFFYKKQGKYDEAERLYQRALTINERVLGRSHPNTAISLNNLASLYQQQGRYMESKSLYQSALTIYEQLLGPHHPDTTAIQANYASLLQKKR